MFVTNALLTSAQLAVIQRAAGRLATLEVEALTVSEVKTGIDFYLGDVLTTGAVDSTELSREAHKILNQLEKGKLDVANASCSALSRKLNDFVTAKSIRTADIGPRDYLQKELLNFDLPTETKRKTDSLRADPPEIILIDLIDDPQWKHYAKRTQLMLQSILGDSREVQKIHYRRIDPSVAHDPKKTIWAFSGRSTPFNDEPRPWFEKRFAYLLDLIRNSRDPMLMFCAGHQLYGLAYGAMVTNIGLMGSERIIFSELSEAQKIERPNHPYFEVFMSLPSQAVFYNNYQHVRDLDDPRAVPLAFRLAPNGVSVPTVFDHYDPQHPEIHRATFQYHPEKIFVVKEDGDSEEKIDIESQRTHIAGLVQLVDILYLLHHREMYAEKKRSYYDSGEK